MKKSKDMHWSNFMSFYGSAEGFLNLSFENINLFNWVTFILAEVLDYNINFTNLKMLKKDKVIHSKEDIMNDFFLLTKHLT
jgi:hypothetical protein